jgi:hypothetical protein
MICEIEISFLNNWAIAKTHTIGLDRRRVTICAIWPVTFTSDPVWMSWMGLNVFWETRLGHVGGGRCWHCSSCQTFPHKPYQRGPFLSDLGTSISGEMKKEDYLWWARQMFWYSYFRDVSAFYLSTNSAPQPPFSHGIYFTVARLSHAEMSMG